MKINNLATLREEIQRASYRRELGKEKLLGDLRLLPYHMIQEVLKNISRTRKK